MRLLGGGEGDGVGMEMVCGKIQVPKVAVGMAPKDFFIKPVFCCLEIFRIWVCLWAAAGKTGKEVQFQGSQISWLEQDLH